jgi:hypothetical protein
LAISALTEVRAQSAKLRKLADYVIDRDLARRLHEQADDLLARADLKAGP